MAPKVSQRTAQKSLGDRPTRPAGARRRTRCSAAGQPNRDIATQAATGDRSSVRILTTKRTDIDLTSIPVTTAPPPDEYDSLDEVEVSAADLIKRNKASRKDIAASVHAIILAGGTPNGANPLTERNPEAALPFGSNYRLVDLAIANCIDAGVDKMHVLTQYNSSPLHAHVAATYPCGIFGTSRGDESFVDVLTTTQSPSETDWARGSADAVSRHFGREWRVELGGLDGHGSPVPDDVLIMPGAAVARFDFASAIAVHRGSGADVTIIGAEVEPEDAANRLGVFVVGGDGVSVAAFAEKPSACALEKLHESCARHSELCSPQLLASTGCYVFSRRALLELTSAGGDAFGADVLPRALAGGWRVSAFEHEGHWGMVGSLRAYRDANLALAGAGPDVPIDLLGGAVPLRSRSRTLPPSAYGDSEICESLIGEGCLIRDGCLISRSVVGCCSYLATGAVVEDSVLLGGAFVSRRERFEAEAAGAPTPGVGARSVVRGAVVDEDAAIGADCFIANEAGVREANRPERGYVIRDGVVAILKGAVIPDGTVI